MTSVRRNLFDPYQLLQLAGEKAFKRGQGYAEHGHIALLGVNGDGVLAAAFGTDDYTVCLNLFPTWTRIVLEIAARVFRENEPQSRMIPSLSGV